jgi:protein-tyrosine-phosphatase
VPRSSNDPSRIFWLAFGYFAFYIPYSAMTKALSQGLLPGQDGQVPGFLLLPATVIATTAGLLAAMTMAGGWSSLGRWRLGPLNIPTVRSLPLISGLATAVIIATTTLNYTSTGISILLALLLMRGGVLSLAPVVDTAFGRRVRASSWVALGLSFVAICLALSDVNGYQMTWPAALTIAAYLGGYVVRISLMTRVAKSTDPTVNRRFFYEEMAVAAIALTAVPALVAAFGQGEIAGQLRDGFTVFFATKLVWPALLIGLLYACLYLFGTSIYLDDRENTFCIPLNRCSTLVSGIVSSYALTIFLGWRPPSYYQLAGALIVIVALGVLLQASLREKGRAGVAVLAGRRLFLFVCGGNTSRSPMAQAICNAEIARRLGLDPPPTPGELAPFYALSAGLTAEPGRPLTDAAASTLLQLGVRPHAHTSRPITAELVDQAERIYCMTESQKTTLVDRFPGAAAKVERLDPLGDLDDPSGHDSAAFSNLGNRLLELIRHRLSALPGLTAGESVVAVQSPG